MEHVIWDVSPEIFQIGGLALRWYGLLFALAFVLGFWFLKSVYRREDRPAEDLDRLFFGLVIGTIVGARLGHVLLYEPGYFLERPLEILMVWKGGLASHGALAGMFLAVWTHSRSHPDQPMLWVTDRLSIPVLLGAMLVRVGNLFNSEILGRPTDVPWAFVFARVDPIPRHPVQLYEALAYLGTLLFVLALYLRKGPAVPKGGLAGPALTMAFTLRLLLEEFKTRQEAFFLPVPLTMGQLLSVPVIVVGVALTVSAWGGTRRTGR